MPIRLSSITSCQTLTLSRDFRRCYGIQNSVRYPLQSFDSPKRQRCFSSEPNMHIQLTTIFGNPTFSVLRFDDPQLKGSPLQFFMQAGLVQLANATKSLANLADWTKQARMDNYWGSVWSRGQLCNYAISMRPNQTLRGGRKLFTTWEEHQASCTHRLLQCVQEK